MDMSHATSTPAIRIYDSGAHHSHFTIPRRSSSYATPTAIPMAIPNARDSPPPPLPPPRHITELSEGQDPGWQWGNGPNSLSFGKNSFGSVKPGSSLLGGQVKRTQPSFDEGDYGTAARRGSSLSTVKPQDTDMGTDSQSHHSDDDRPDLPRPSLANHRLQSERQLGQRSLEDSSQAYDKQLLSKIGGPNTPTRSSGSGFLSTSAQETSTSPHNTLSKLNGQLKPLSMPERRMNSIDLSAAGWPPSSGGISPGQTGFRSPIYGPAPSEHPRPYGSVSGPAGYDEPHSHRGSYDHTVFLEPDFAMEENGMRDLNLNDRSPAGSDEYQLSSHGGLKRRASSPPSEAAREDRPSGGNDLYHRRSAQMLVNRNSPISRFHTNHGSVSSTSSIGQRNGSLGSSYGLSVASSATSYHTDRLSPSTLSPAVDEFGPISPYSTTRSLNPSPRGSLSKIHHQRGLSGEEAMHARKLSADSLAHSRQNSVSKLQGMYICECCPKKPKKFDSEDELRLHEMEKQYTCQYCPNRFKNKNEAERHQNSLHLRRHSWSCAALSGVQAAFHPSTVHPQAADVCGYCGEEFPNPANWDVRGDHLNHVHKFGECNQAKKFYRADHFRQHLKHSHAGTSGKWTNMLENACMKDEPPPPKDRLPSVASLPGAPPIAQQQAAAALSVAVPKPGVISEARDES
ncbi:uncharacterized protein J3D65DRAFT_105893 [Phyllosticta citribraziliensis]|uniref:C2H2-type domain-containing protein n=1 Tax=Phyllosticta citribraziliensis TaxID=989973 RepID=A0ABR1LCN2_9PEZI